MRKYYLYVCMPLYKGKEQVIADSIVFNKEMRVNFYRNHTLIKSYPSQYVIIEKIEDIEDIEDTENK